MTSDVADARLLSPGSGEGQRLRERVGMAGRERGPIKRARCRTCGSWSVAR